MNRRLPGVLGLMLLAAVLSMSQLAMPAQALPPNCYGLPCWDQSDCGSHCICRDHMCDMP